MHLLYSTYYLNTGLIFIPFFIKFNLAANNENTDNNFMTYKPTGMDLPPKKIWALFLIQTIAATVLTFLQYLMKFLQTRHSDILKIKSLENLKNYLMKNETAYIKNSCKLIQIIEI